MRRALLALALAGCAIHQRHNAPGLIDPRTPPKDLDVAEVEEPGDPGEEMLTVTIGPMGAAGGGFLGPGFDGLGLAAEAGPEIGFHRGTEAKSHNKPDLFPFPHAYPFRTEGVNVGWSILSPDGDEAAIGRIYLEYQRRDLLAAWAVGYGVDPDDGVHGPHVTLSFTNLYVRAAYEFDRGATVLFGGFFKVPITFVRSR